MVVELTKGCDQSPHLCSWSTQSRTLAPLPLPISKSMALLLTDPAGTG